MRLLERAGSCARHTAPVIAAFILHAPLLASAFTNETCGLASAGGWSSNASFRSFHVLGQEAAAAALATNVDFAAWSGQLGAFVMSPGRDADGDGLADENDLNDDGDGLPDSVELAGSAFDPATPTDPLSTDSDADGSDDRDEAVAGTNPRNEDSRLEFISVSGADGDGTVVWRGRRDRRYAVLSGTNAVSLRDNPSLLGTVTAVGGAAPWYETETSFTNSLTVRNRCYWVRVLEE